MNGSQSERPAGSAVGYLLVGVIWFLAFVAVAGLLYFGIWFVSDSWGNAYHHLTFARAEATVTRSWVASEPAKGSFQYWPVVEYRYAVNGNQYDTQEELRAFRSWEERDAVEMIASHFQPGQSSEVCYDASHPSNAFLADSHPLDVCTMAFSLAFAGMATLAIRYRLTRSRESRSREHQQSPAS